MDQSSDGINSCVPPTFSRRMCISGNNDLIEVCSCMYAVPCMRAVGSVPAGCTLLWLMLEHGFIKQPCVRRGGEQTCELLLVLAFPARHTLLFQSMELCKVRYRSRQAFHQGHCPRSRIIEEAWCTSCFYAKFSPVAMRTYTPSELHTSSWPLSCSSPLMPYSLRPAQPSREAVACLGF